MVAIARYQRVLISVPDGATRRHLAHRLACLGVAADRLTLVVADSDDTWTGITARWPLSAMGNSSCSTMSLPAGAASSKPPVTTP